MPRKKPQSAEEEEEVVNNDTNTPVKVPKKRSAPKKAKAKVETPEGGVVEVWNGCIKIERGSFKVVW